jgi:hypothetical protein
MFKAGMAVAYFLTCIVSHELIKLAVIDLSLLLLL